MDGKQTDHIDGDGLNNLRSNLRNVNSRINALNRPRRRMGLTSSRFPGVSFCSDRNRWEAKIQIDKTTVHLGRFISEQDAATAYRVAYEKKEKEALCT